MFFYDFFNTKKEEKRSAKAVANYFINLSKSTRVKISHLKLQKLVFFSHCWYLALKDDPLVEDEYAEAWEYGPVFPTIYHHFKHLGPLPIENFAVDKTIDKNFNEQITMPVLPEDNYVFKVLNRIWEVYGDKSGGVLSELSHAEGSPWSETRRITKNKRNANISNEVIKEIYKKRLDS